MINNQKPLLLQNVHHVDLPESVDILIDNGVISQIGKIKSSTDHDVYDCSSWVAYPSFVDVGTSINSPGYEERETLEELEDAAIQGGYTDLITLPHTDPITDNAAMIQLQKTKSKQLHINLHPLGALSVGLKGTDITEMMEMNEAGAVGYTEGYQPSTHPGFLMRGLDYVRSIDGIILSMPYEKDIMPSGLIHEGNVSTQLGMTGLPTISETLRIKRDLDLLDYTDSRLFIWNISSSESVDLIREAKKAGKSVYCSVSYLHLIYTDEALQDYNPYLKVLPPLRAERDRQALINACLDGTIDVISSQHRPWDVEHKMVEFPYAEYGTRGLEIVYSALYTHCPELFKSEKLSSLLSHNPREIFNLPTAEVKKGNKAAIILIDNEESRDISPQNHYDKKAQFPIIDKVVKGTIQSQINKLILNQNS